ncbi:hypothetical protein GGS26DRAFT_568520 [Hypomontagnella submonticulosa]|nr:hypothetical protein GGS26DRAFT_568520 [Hypomontagnella submonticulosa]
MCGLAEKHLTSFCATACEGLSIGTGNKFLKCPRSILTKVAGELAKASGAQLLVSFEIQFTILDKKLRLVKSADRLENSFRATWLRRSMPRIKDEITEALLKCRVEIRQSYAESDSQLKIILAPLPVIEACDAFMLARETVRAIFEGEGVKATMSTKPLSTGPRNGSPMYVSLNGIDEKVSNSFVAGVLDRLPALCAFGMPHPDSYCRVEGGGVGEYVGWGTETNDLPIKKINPNQWEFRFFDATANIYLAAAATLASGLNGVHKAMKLSARDCSISLDSLTLAQLDDYGISEYMPKSLRESLRIVGEDSDMRKWLGDKLFDEYIGVKQAELAAFRELSGKEKRLECLRLF